MSYHKRNLPHWQPPGAEFFVTFRLAGSLPRNAKEILKEQEKFYRKTGRTPELKTRRMLEKYRDQLDHNIPGPFWLANPDVSDLVFEAIRYRDKKQYDLYAFCIMHNHVHLVCKLLNQDGTEYPLSRILQSLKAYTARKANKILNRSGQFWMRESYDRVIRTQDELERTINYVLYNPVKAGLVASWKDWKYSYCKEEFLETFK